MGGLIPVDRARSRARSRSRFRALNVASPQIGSPQATPRKSRTKDDDEEEDDWAE
jgi:hypothetical protein